MPLRTASRTVYLCVLAMAVCLRPADAQIYRWDNGQLIPGTEDITLGPTVQLDGLDLQGAELSLASLLGASLVDTNLTGARLSDATLIRANLTRANLTDARMLTTVLANANLTQANLRGAELETAILSGANLSFADLTEANLWRAWLNDANLSGAVVTGSRLWETTQRGFTKEQLYSTSSYLQKNLHGIQLRDNDLTGWSFAGQDLTGADLSAILLDADLTDAMISRTDFTATTPYGFTAQQFYFTASYQQHDLRGVRLTGNNLAGWNFSGQDLTGALFTATRLTNANLTDATVAEAGLWETTVRGFTREQLYSTASYKQKDLHGINLGGNDLAEWNLAGQNLAGASFILSSLADADLKDAVITRGSFSATTLRGFTKEQLYSTASYKAKNLYGVNLGENDLSGWDFSAQNLALASFTSATLTGADFTDAVVTGASFAGTTGLGFTPQQLYSTASYQRGKLQRIRWTGNDLSGWDLSQRYLVDADFTNAALSDTNLTNSDLRGSGGFNPQPSTQTQNTILPTGVIEGLELQANDSLVVRNYFGQSVFHQGPLAVTIQDRMHVSDQAVLRLILDSEPWESTITLADGASIQLGGSLELEWDDSVDLAQQAGRSFQLFHWSDVPESGNRFDHVDVTQGEYYWFLSNLYSTGTVSLRLAGDADGDQQVDAADLTTIILNWTGDGAPCDDPTVAPLGDFDGDCDVDAADLNQVIVHWTGAAEVSEVQGIPEPTGLPILLLAVLPLLAPRRKRSTGAALGQSENGRTAGRRIAG